MKMSYDYFQQGKIYRTLTRIIAVPQEVWDSSPKPSKKSVTYMVSPTVYFLENNKFLLFINWLDSGEGRRNGLFFSEDTTYVIPVSENYNFYDNANSVSNFSKMTDE